MELYVNPDKGTVVAKITNIREQMRASLNKIIDGAASSSNLQPIINRMPDTVIGIARCSSNDAFVDEVGIDLARNRAIVKHAEARRRAFNDALVFLTYDLAVELKTKIRKCNATAITRGQEIARFLESGYSQDDTI